LDAIEGSARPDPVEDFKTITAELKAFDPTLPQKPTILVATKADVANPDKLKKLKSFATRRKLPFYTISAVTGEGIDKLKYAIAESVTKHRTHEPAPPPEPALYKKPKPKPAYPPPPPKASGSRTH
jgi:GTP-binding protein